ncbi:hypothetical protein VPNG_03969 [Cytospora leucostoma]|uniref:Nucleolar complex-associated protein 3 n=1 Tax=Cytospora leucostoma TaxID=1230097 RepID=A0A423XE86_9PEZI|nr:hypothetical protein VPNG_03969 [Cytospora leucostoma]
MLSRPSKKRRLSPSDDGISEKKVQKAFFKNASSWNLEQDYESRPRKGKKNKENTKLPIKTADGRVEQASTANDDTASVDDDDAWLEENQSDGAEEDEPEQVEAPPTIPEREQILRAKEELAKIALHLSEDPEEHPGAFKQLARIGESRLPAVQKLCMVTQLAVYKDVIPGYRIRPAIEDPAGQKLSKEVKSLRSYEHALVAGYQVYVKKLAEFAKLKGSAQNQGLSKVAITCACTLVSTVSHFNFRTDLLKILVGKLSSRKVDESYNKCLTTLDTLFREDEEGRPSMEAVSLLAKMMKAKSYQLNEGVLNLFLSLRLLSEFSGKASRDTVEIPDGDKPQKKKWEFRTKRERKDIKVERALAKEMAQADASVSHEERDHMQSETLKLVFATYFRILKQRLPNLMGAVLEGLSNLFSLSMDPDLELGARSLRLPDPDAPQPAKPNKVNLQTMTVLLVRCLTAILLPPWNIRSVPPLRIAAFTKQLMTTALQVPEKSCQAILALVNDVHYTHGKKLGALFNTEERKGDGTFNPFSESIEGSNPFATTVWEGELLRRHYCPQVREGQKLLEKSLRTAHTNSPVSTVTSQEIQTYYGQDSNQAARHPSGSLRGPQLHKPLLRSPKQRDTEAVSPSTRAPTSPRAEPADQFWTKADESSRSPHLWRKGVFQKFFDHQPRGPGSAGQGTPAQLYSRARDARVSVPIEREERHSRAARVTKTVDPWMETKRKIVTPGDAE